MTAQAWLAAFDEPVPASGLRNPQAVALATFVDRYCEEVATFVEARRQGERELLVLDVRTGAPQAPAYPIRHTERVGILFARDDALAFVVMLRDDFPDTEHQQLVPEGHPAVVCIDDRPWPEARLTWTPAELVERILSWFRRAARGELHDARQPLDPVFMGSQLGFVVARSILAADAAEDLIAEHDPEQTTILRVKRLTDIGEIRNGMAPICIAAYRVPPERMTRLRFAPVSLGGLATMLAARGVDLYADLTVRFTQWLADGQRAAWRLNAPFAVIIEMPVVSARGEQQEGLDLRAFVSPQPAGEIAVALGVALKPQAKDEGSSVGYVKMIAPAGIDRPVIDAVEMQSAEVHLEFERDLAARLAGRSVPDTRKAVLVGAGALGSHLADCLMREGRFRWTVIDDDHVLPHNLARHVARNDKVIRPKAKVLTDCLNTTLAGDGDLAEPVAANLFAGGEQGAIVTASLNAADLIIDATASVLAGRALSDHETQARRLSAFLNPAGEAAVLLAEPAGRALTLRDLEAQYLGLVLRTGRLADHLGKDPETVAYTGACRAITNRIPQSRVSVLAGLIASGVSRALDGTKAVISIWSLALNGEVTLDSATPEPVLRYRALTGLLLLMQALPRAFARCAAPACHRKPAAFCSALSISLRSRFTWLMHRRRRLTAKSGQVCSCAEHGASRIS
jgi:hypothetical protein